MFTRNVWIVLTTVRLTWRGEFRIETILRVFLRFVFLFRDILITPKRLNYAREKEKELYESLISLTNSRQIEIQRLISQAIKDNEESLADQACSLEIPGRKQFFTFKNDEEKLHQLILLGIEFTDELTVKTARDLKRCTNEIQDFVLLKLNEAIASQLSKSVTILHQDYVGTLTRCLKHLEGQQDDDESGASASKALREVNFSSFYFYRPIRIFSNI